MALMLKLNRRTYGKFGITNVIPFEQKQGEVFLKVLFYRCTEGYIEIRPLPAGQRRWIAIGDFQNDVLPIDKDVYFGVATREYGKGTKNDVIQIPAVWVDIDFKQIPKEDADERIKSFRFPPTLGVESGGGYHLYWCLEHPASKGEIKRIEDMNRRLSLHFGGDIGSVDASRILRLPGTMNHKYTPLAPVGVSTLHPDTTYNLEDFEQALSSTESEYPKVVNTSGWQNELLKGVENGHRTITATKLAGRYYSKGLSSKEVFYLLKSWNENNTPPLEKEKLFSVVESINRTRQRGIATGDKAYPEIDYDEIVQGSIMTYPELMEKNIADPIFIMKPWLSENTMALIAAPRGVGKTFICISLALAITRGIPIGAWQPENPVGCLYIDGEMPVAELKRRINRLSKNLPEEKAPLHIMSVPLMQLEGKPSVTFSNEKWLESISHYLEREKHIKLIIIDNLSSLSPRVGENEKIFWDPINQQLLSLRARGVSSILVHHTGKGGDQRGTSGREDQMDVCIHLVRPDGYNPKMGAKFNVEFTKARHFYGEDATPFCFRIVPDGPIADRADKWEVNDYIIPGGDLEKKVIELLVQGKVQKDIAKEVNCSASYVSQIKKRTKEKGFLDDTGKLTETGKNYYGFTGADNS